MITAVAVAVEARLDCWLGLVLPLLLLLSVEGISCARLAFGPTAQPSQQAARRANSLPDKSDAASSDDKMSGRFLSAEKLMANNKHQI